MHDEEDQDDHDDQDAEDCEDGEEEDDGISHATVVADPAETTKPQGEREVLERDDPGEDEGEDEGEDRDERKKKMKPNTCLPQVNQR